MTINAKVESMACITAVPPISYPFLFKSIASGTVFLRIKSRDRCHHDHNDVALVPGLHTSTEVCSFHSSNGFSDNEAWGMRLPKGDTVVLSNG